MFLAHHYVITRKLGATLKSKIFIFYLYDSHGLYALHK